MNPQLADLIAQYVVLGGAQYNAFPNIGNPQGIPNFHVNEPSYVFAKAGPLAIAEIFTGPGLKAAVFNAALELQEHGVDAAGTGWWATVTQPVKDAVAAYIVANPTLVPQGVPNPGLELAVPAPTAPQTGNPAGPTPVPLTSPIPGMSVADIQYIDAVGNFWTIPGGGAGYPGGSPALFTLVAPAGTTKAQIDQAVDMVDYSNTAQSIPAYAGPFLEAVQNALNAVIASKKPAGTVGTVGPTQRMATPIEKQVAKQAAEAAAGPPLASSKKPVVPGKTTSSQQNISNFGGKR